MSMVKASGIGLGELQRLEDYPSVRPLFEQRNALQARVQALGEAIKAKRQSLYEIDHKPDIPLPVRTRRNTRQQLEDLEVEEEAARVELDCVHEQVEAAKKQAKAELQPALDQEALLVLGQVEVAMKQLIAAQGALSALDAQTRRLGRGVWTGGMVDVQLPFRLKRVQEAMRARAKRN